MPFNGYHHIGLYVKDGGESLRFYTEGLGGKITFSFPMSGSDKTIYLVDLGGGAVVEIIPRGGEEAESNPRWVHVAVATDDARAAYQLAIDAGAKAQSAPTDAMLGTMAVCNAFVKGPDGETIEFFQVK
ncbi:MAG: VOC family protein [Oscillospiraceae bacterium]|jgi:lactoylglutathione lyase|nr:VOC family protein [Oscillospiraceae bacterium]